MRSAATTQAFAQLRRADIGWLSRAARQWLWLKHGRGLPGVPEGLAPTGPITVNLLPTLRCPSRCGMCTLERVHRPQATRELDSATLRGLIDEVRGIGALAVSISGGEPLLRPDLPGLVTAAKARGLASSVSTNGLLLTTDGAEALVGAGLDQITVSLDATEDDDYRGFRGASEGAGRVLAAIERLAEARARTGSGMQVVVSMAVRAHRIDAVSAVMEAGAEAGADAIAFAPVHRIERAAVRCASLRRWDQRAFTDRIAQRPPGLRIDSSPAYLALFERAFAGEPFPLPCATGWTMLSVDPTGAIYPCAPWLMQGRAVGSWRPGGLERWWRDDGTRALRLRLAACRACYWNCYAEHSLLFGGPAPREASTP